MRYASIIATLSAILLTAPVVTSAQGSASADNTKVNQRDRQSNAVTADQQNNGKSDVQITADIRKALMQDKDLSTYAHNVKIVTHNGTVTLKGPVRSADEKKTIEAKAEEVAGSGKVKSMISVSPKS